MSPIPAAANLTVFQNATANGTDAQWIVKAGLAQNLKVRIASVLTS
jgi:hypothetical protein